MRVEEIALRQEIRQMLSEVGLDKTSLHEMAKEVLKEEIAKQVKNALNQSNINGIVYSKVNSYELREMMREAIKQEVRDAVSISIDVKATIPKKN